MKPYILMPMLAAVILSSCNKNNDDLGAPQDASKAEFFFNDVNNISDEACNTGDLITIKSMNGVMSGCATVTLDTLAMPHTCTIDFGSANCLCTDGKYRRGMINVSFTGRYRDAGTTITITPANYFVNDNQVIGVHTVVNQGTNGNGNIYYSVDVTGQVILANGGGTISWTSSRTREWIAGSNTADFSDDIYSISGSGTGTSAGGANISIQITSPLVRKLEPGCRSHFISGTVEVTPGNLPTRILDFGNGECDNIATVTVNGHTYTIQLW
jgi:hypothetical protein